MTTQATRTLREVCLVITLGLAFLFSCAGSQASELVLIHGKRTRSATTKQIEDVAHFYGLTVNYLEVTSSSSKYAIDQVRRDGTLGVLIAADTLRELDRDQVLAALHRK